MSSYRSSPSEQGRGQAQNYNSRSLWSAQPRLRCGSSTAVLPDLSHEQPGTWVTPLNGLSADDVVPFVEFGQEDGVEADGPDPIFGLFQSDVVIGERLRDEEQAVLKAERPASRDFFHQEVPGVFLRRPVFRVRPW